MKIGWMDRIGDWNPQMLREFQGRFKSRNVMITTAISLVGQFILFMAFQGQLPVDYRLPTDKYPLYNRYCTGTRQLCLKDALGDLIINWSH